MNTTGKNWIGGYFQTCENVRNMLRIKHNYNKLWNTFHVKNISLISKVLLHTIYIINTLYRKETVSSQHTVSRHANRQNSEKPKNNY